MNEDFTKEDEQDIDFDPKKIKDVLLGDDELLDGDDVALDDAEESEEDYTFDGDSDPDEDY